MKRKNNLELLAPAGSPEKIKYAFHYGADAVYAGVPDFSMRRRINAFTEKSLAEGIKYAHENGKKFYVTLNIYAHNTHISKIEKHLKFLKVANPDAIILSDPGILSLVKKHLPKMEIHLSTQANATNWQAVKFWAEQGVKRVILAREVTLKEIKEIKKRFPKIELEHFVHGAMCMSYSGRCVLSKWMVGRSANLGDCAQPCRWLYRGTRNPKPETRSANIEDERGEFEINIEEDNQGTYFFNSKDLNLLDHINEMKKAGVESFKIEGRNKSVYYLAVVVRAYRKVLDAVQENKSKKEIDKITKEQQKELGKLMHRGYTTGFLLGEDPEHNFSDSHEESSHEFVGEVLGNKNSLLRIKAHNALRLGDKVEIVTPEKNISFQVKSILDNDLKETKSAHGGQNRAFYVESQQKDVDKFDLIRKIR